MNEARYWFWMNRRINLVTLAEKMVMARNGYGEIIRRFGDDYTLTERIEQEIKTAVEYANAMIRSEMQIEGVTK